MRKRINMQELRGKLLNGTIYVIAENGLDGATTKRISQYTQLNEAYIYRAFEDKITMFACAFDVLDDEFVACLMQSIDENAADDQPIREALDHVFRVNWRFMLDGIERCMCFMQYFYSPYFVNLSKEKHYQKFSVVVERLAPFFRNEGDALLLLSHVLDTMLIWALKVSRGEVEDNDETANLLFDILYASLAPYLK